VIKLWEKNFELFFCNTDSLNSSNLWHSLKNAHLFGFLFWHFSRCFCASRRFVLRRCTTWCASAGAERKTRGRRSRKSTCSSSAKTWVSSPTSKNQMTRREFSACALSAEDERLSQKWCFQEWIQKDLSPCSLQNRRHLTILLEIGFTHPRSRSNDKNKIFQPQLVYFRLASSSRVYFNIF
jgi:hypothetical protein